MPALAAALAVETDPAAASALEAALVALEQAPPPTLHVRLMGEFSVRRGERDLTDWHRPAVRRLFQYFVLHRGEHLGRDRILDDLWPGADPATARASFNQGFSWLRRLLEPAMRPRAGSRYLALDEDRYCFDPRRDPQVAQVDIDAVEAIVRPYVALAGDDRQTDLPPLPEALLAALAAWKPALPEAPYESWAVEPRERLLNLYVEGCLYAARGLLERARPAEATPWAARVVASAPWREEGYQVLMQAQARQGERGLALKTFAEAVTALERELNAAPSALTRWLGQRLQQGEEI
jgi:DNA-binding SARP family transcriptional activator